MVCPTCKDYTSPSSWRTLLAGLKACPKCGAVCDEQIVLAVALDEGLYSLAVKGRAGSPQVLLGGPALTAASAVADEVPKEFPWWARFAGWFMLRWWRFRYRSSRSSLGEMKVYRDHE